MYLLSADRKRCLDRTFKSESRWMISRLLPAPSTSTAKGDKSGIVVCRCCCCSGMWRDEDWISTVVAVVDEDAVVQLALLIIALLIIANTTDAS